MLAVLTLTKVDDAGKMACGTSWEVGAYRWETPEELTRGRAKLCGRLIAELHLTPVGVMTYQAPDGGTLLASLAVSSREEGA